MRDLRVLAPEDAMSATEPSTDALIGMTWWNRLTERERRDWMRRAGDTGVAANAWECFKRENCGLPGAKPSELE